MKIEDKLVASVISGLKALYSQEVPEKMCIRDRACTVRIHRHADSRFAVLVEFVFGICYYVTFQRGFAVAFGRFDCIQFERLTFFVKFGRRNTPFQTEVFWKF